MSKLEEDIELAQKVILGLDNSVVGYNETSYIYRCTNENMKDKTYMNLMRNNKNALAVIGSGDQILNMFLLNSNNFDAFDISRFPSYYLKLKMAAIKEFTYEEYLAFFFDRRPFSKNMFDRLMYSCEDEECKKFWTKVCGRYPEEVLNTQLFTDTRHSSMYAIGNNPYLDRDNYYKLKSKIDSININYINGDILDIGSNMDKSYDLIYLSNICCYSREMFEKYIDLEGFKQFRGFITNLKINPDGKVVNYLHKYSVARMTYRIVNDVFNTQGFTNYEVKKDRDIPDMLIVYKKVR